jgi:hypothetical protein
MPLVYGAGEVAQVDFFEVRVELAGVRQKAWLFLMRLMHSGRDFAMLCAQRDATRVSGGVHRGVPALRRCRLSACLAQ